MSYKIQKYVNAQIVHQIQKYANTQIQKYNKHKKMFHKCYVTYNIYHIDGKHFMSLIVY